MIVIILLFILGLLLDLIIFIAYDSEEMILALFVKALVEAMLFIILLCTYFSTKVIPFNNDIYLNFKTNEIKIDKCRNTLQIYDIQFKDSTRNEIIFKYRNKSKEESTIPKF